MELSFNAIYENGVLKPPEPLPLADHAEVRVVVQAPRVSPCEAVDSALASASPTVAERLREFIGCVDGLPEDAARNHDHYLYGGSQAMTSAVFADTTFYVALVNRRDALHVRAFEWAVQNSRNVVTTEFVLLEVANFFKKSGDRETFARLVDRLEEDPSTTVVPAESDLFREGLQLFASRRDKEWSLTDCISFVVMARHALAETLSSDHHFEQAGFRALLA